MGVVAIDPANRTRIVGVQIGVFSLLGRAVRVLVSRGRIIMSERIRGLTSLVGWLVVPTISAPAAVLLALVALVVNFPLDSRWILRLRQCGSRLRWVICRWRLHGCSYLRGLLILLWSGLWVCHMGFLWRAISELGL